MNPAALTDLPTAAAARSPIARVEATALGVTIACGLAAWGFSLRTCGYDYDEVVRAHSVWLAATGLRPYNDFFECHPPYFRLLVPVIQGQGNPLFALRIFAGVGNLLFLGGLGVLAAALVATGRRWAWMGVAVVAMNRDVLNDLVEFRIDGWGYAVATWGFIRHRHLAKGAYRDFELGVVSGVATLLFCPKLTILPALVVLAGQITAPVSPRRAVASVLAYGVGVGVAVGLFLGWLAWQGIEPGRMTQLLVRYHAVSGANAGFHFGLLGAIQAHRTLLALTLAGLAGWGFACVRRRVWPGAYEVALLAWLAAQLVLVAYPYKQYFAPWFLFGAAYLGFLGQGGAVWLARVRLIPFLAAGALTSYGAIDAARDWARLDEVRAQESAMRWMDQVAGPEDRVVASPPLHPIDRHDSFFVWFNTADLAGFDSERILARLPSYRANITASRFREELAAHPPALVLLSGSWRMVSYTEGQLAALAEFLPQRGYRSVQVGPVRYAVRPDLLDLARRTD